MTLLRQVFFLLGNKRNQIPWLIALFIGVSLVELLGLGLIVPYMLLIVDPESVVDGKLGRLIMEYFLFLTGDKLIVLMSLGLVSIFLLKALLMIGINRVMIRFSFNLQTQLRCSLMSLYQSLRYTDYLQRNSSEYITALQQYTGTFTTGVLFNLLKMVSEMISLVAIIILLALTNGSMLAILIGLLGSIAYGYDRLFKNKISTYGQKLNDNQELMVQGIHEGIEGLKEIRILGKEDYFHSVVRRTSEKFAHYRGNVQLITIAPRYLLELILVTFIVALVLSTFWTGENLKSLIPTLSLFGFAAIRIIPATNTLINSLSQIRFNLDATSRLYKDLYNHQEDTLLTDGEAVDTTKFEVFEKLTFDKVCFRYPNASRNALDKVDFYIDKGECIGLVGTSGSGKTTLIDTMLGLLEPQNGDLNFNGKPLQANINSWYKNVAYLPQEVFLIDNTLRCNVALGVWAEDIDNDRLKKALSQAQLTDFVDELSNGIETVLGERGVLLSGGQRQRIALARAFYHDRSVLVMDESTSALDDKTESEIVEEIKRLKGKKTMIVIAHRLSTIEHCDRIYRLENGKMVAQGSYESVVGENS